MEVALIICCFVSNALALNFLYNDKKKLTGMLIILNLCLTVALAYQFKQIQNICYVLMVIAALIILILGIKYYLKRKKSKAIVVETREIKNEDD